MTDSPALWTCAYCWGPVDPAAFGEGVVVDVHNGVIRSGQRMAAHRRCFVAHLDRRMALGPMLDEDGDDPGPAG